MESAIRLFTHTYPLKRATYRLARLLELFIIGALTFPALMAWAVTPPPDGGYPNDNTAEGQDALFSLTSGFNNTAVGFFALHDDTTGYYNTALGANALLANTTGTLNTALGADALISNTSGSGNVATGDASLYKNTIGIRNTASGHNALSNNISGNQNSAFGYQALLGGENGAGTGSDNTGLGYWAMVFNESGSNNTAAGSQALYNYNGASNNTATGYLAMYGAEEGSSFGGNNTADGTNALYTNVSGANNLASGMNALYNNTAGNNNTAQGYQALFNNTTGSFNIAVGNAAGANLTSGINNIDIGSPGVAGESKTIRMGKPGLHTATYIAGINGATVAGGVMVMIDSTGHLGTVTSSVRYKENIRPIDTASDTILSLQPVSFRYKKELDPKGIPQFGLVAEEVEKVNPDLVAKDDQGKPYTVRYEAVNAMLLNEFLKEHKKVEEQEARLTDQTKEITELKASLKNMSARLDANGL